MQTYYLYLCLATYLRHTLKARRSHDRGF